MNLGQDLEHQHHPKIWAGEETDWGVLDRLAFFILSSSHFLKTAPLKVVRGKWNGEKLPDDLCLDQALVTLKVKKELVSGQQIVCHKENLLCIQIGNGPLRPERRLCVSSSSGGSRFSSQHPRGRSLLSIALFLVNRLSLLAFTSTRHTCSTQT